MHAAIDNLAGPGPTRRVISSSSIPDGPLKQFQDRMLARGIKVGRHFDGYDSWSRVTIGVRHEVDVFLAALPEALQKA